MKHEHVFYYTTEDGQTAMSGHCMTCPYYTNKAEFMELAGF